MDLILKRDHRSYLGSALWIFVARIFSEAGVPIGDSSEKIEISQPYSAADTLRHPACHAKDAYNRTAK